jgi:uncharacterized protein YaeQ
VALTSTIYNASVDLNDVDRGVYEQIELRLALHPSETMEYMVTRLLAYCLEYTEGIEMTAGLSDGDEPAIVIRDLTGRVTGWIEIGLADADRLHRAAKLAGRVPSTATATSAICSTSSKGNASTAPRRFPSTRSARASSPRWRSASSGGRR